MEPEVYLGPKFPERFNRRRSGPGIDSRPFPLPGTVNIRLDRDAVHMLRRIGELFVRQRGLFTSSGHRTRN